MRLEIDKDLDRERKAIRTFVNMFDGSFKKLGVNDIDYRVYDKDEKIISFVEVIYRHRNMNEAFPLPVSARKIVKLSDKRLNPVMIWACDDGIIYGRITQLSGSIKWCSIKERTNNYNDQELMVDYEQSNPFKLIRYQEDF